MKKRFIVILSIAISLLLSTLFILFVLKNEELFLKGTLFLGMGIWLWFFSDYEMLRKNNYYLMCLGISVLYAVYAIALNIHYKDEDNVLMHFGALHPLTLLLVQRPLRQFYVIFFNTEPKVDRHGKFTDLLYTLILFSVTITIPLLIMEFVKF